jgi:hypothetical protein
LLPWHLRSATYHKLGKKLNTKRIKIYALVAFILFIYGYAYTKTNHWMLMRLQSYYSELEHPAWSQRLGFTRKINPNFGSGDHKVLYLTDIRKISIPLPEAKSYYRSQGVRLGLVGLHVDSFAEAKEKFEWEWKDAGLVVPDSPDTLVISQSVGTDSQIVREKRN